MRLDKQQCVILCINNIHGKIPPFQLVSSFALQKEVTNQVF